MSYVHHMPRFRNTQFSPCIIIRNLFTPLRERVNLPRNIADITISFTCVEYIREKKKKGSEEKKAESAHHRTSCGLNGQLPQVRWRLRAQYFLLKRVMFHPSAEIFVLLYLELGVRRSVPSCGLCLCLRGEYLSDRLKRAASLVGNYICRSRVWAIGARVLGRKIRGIMPFRSSLSYPHETTLERKKIPRLFRWPDITYIFSQAHVMNRLADGHVRMSPPSGTYNFVPACTMGKITKSHLLVTADLGVLSRFTTFK